MAVRLNAWLAETFEVQLALANHWLQERHEKKKSGVKTEGDRAWDGLYHDNGSCLEIINYIHPERNSALQVLETRPWTLTDGRHHIVAHLTPDCARDFATRYPAVSYLSPGSTIAVHLVSLNHQGAIGTVLEKLRETRAREDRRCLSIDQVPTNDTMARHDAPDSGSQPTSQMLHTQAPFGTQLQPPTRAYSDSDESPDPDEAQSVGKNSLEPVRLGNRHTKCVEIRPEQAAARYEKLHSLLNSLKNPVGKSRPADSALQAAFGGPKERAVRQPPSQPIAPEPGWIRNSFARPEPSLDREFFNEENLQPEKLGSDVHDTAPVHWNTEGWEEDIKQEPQSPRSREQSGTEALSRASRDREATDSAERQGDSVAHNVPEQDTASSLECSWMKGFIFNSETLKVSKLQQQCLTKDTSWLHPPPGCPPFQDGNMPQSILAVLNRIADERANAEDDETGDDDSDIDPSPDSLPVDINLSAESVPQTTQENDQSDDEDEVTSWVVSPKSPPRPLRPHQDLPPDSSPIQKLGAGQPSTPPKPSVKQSQHPEVVELSDDEPLAAQPLSISDDEMEMEECIPQALGEDFPAKTGPCTDIPAVSSPKTTPRQSVAQVMETPYGKGKAAQLTDAISLRRPVSKQTPDLSSESKNKSSVSIVHSTSIAPQALSSVEVAQNPTDKKDSTRTHQIMVSRAGRESQSKMAGTGAVHASEEVQVVDELLETETDILSGTTTKPFRLQEFPSGSSSNMPQAASRSTKRKLPASPTRGNRGKSKRLEISLVGFGDSPPPSVDPLVQLREERAESYRKFREQRNSGTNLESLHQPTTALMDEQSMDPTDLDSADILGNEPRSDRRSLSDDSLYKEPSPRPVRHNALVQSRPLHRQSQLRDEARSSQAKYRSTPSLQPQYASAVSDEESRRTVFESFKAAYPEYSGDTIHFHTQCENMYRLDLEDKMVPKWQWDDFIIRNRTDYRDYAMECLERSETIEPYHRFYKDNIRDTLYRRGIIKGRQTLEQALEEAGIAIEDVDAPDQPLMGPPSRPLPLRKSLPGSFDQMKPRDSSVAVSHARPRQSLPTSSHAQQPYQHGTPSASRFHTPRRSLPLSQQHYRQSTSSVSSFPTLREITRAPRPLQQERTGDPFRDFYNDYQRKANHENNPWPRGVESRPSIADIPRLEVKVLQWGGVL